MRASSRKSPLGKKILVFIADCADQALTGRTNYRECCAIPNLARAVQVALDEVNSELCKLAPGGFVTVHEEVVYPTWRTLVTHQAFNGISMEQGDTVVATLKAAAKR
jgi:hypothetical protein